MRLRRFGIVAVALYAYLYVLLLLVPEANAKPAVGDLASISYGETVEGLLSVAGEIDEYTFSGFAGDVVVVRMASVWANAPRLEVYGPGGLLLAGVSAPSSGTADVDTLALPSDGDYTILAMDHNGNDTGEYSLCLQLVSEPGSASAIGYGETAVDTITSRAEMAAFTFPGTMGDVVVVRMACVWHNAPRLEVYGPSGLQLAEVSAPSLGTADIDALALPSDGDYTILAMDYNGNDTGEYGLCLQLVSQSGSGSAISYGETAVDTITSRAEMTAFTFPGTMGDVVVVRMASVWANAPRLEVYGPSGLQLAEVSAPSLGTADIDALALPSDGDYTILAMDYNGNNTGEYGLCLQLVSQPGSGSVISYGETAVETITSRAEMTAFAFPGTMGDVVVVRMACVWNNAPRLEVYGPSGLQLAEVSAPSPGTADVDTLALPSDGDYTILAMDYNGNDTGEYGLCLQLVSEPGSGSAIGYGATVEDSIRSQSEMAAFTFAGSVGDAVVVRMVSMWNNATHLAMYGPDGGQLADVTSYSGNPAHIDTLCLQSDGEYTILAMDYNGNNIGDYSLELHACACPFQCDYDEDGFLTALDLGFLIDVLFAGLPETRDASCPTSRGDFNKDGFPDALDLGALIDHLFQGGVTPIDPCATACH